MDLFIGLVALFFFIIIFYGNNFLFLIFLIFIFIFFLFFSLFFRAMWLTGSWSTARCQPWASEVGEPSSGHWTTRDLLTPHNISIGESSPRDLLLNVKTQLHPMARKAPVLDTPCQTTSKTGTQPHPLAERLPKIILSSHTPQNTPPHTALPTRETRSSPTYQNTGTSPLHQEAYTTHWTNLTNWGQTPKTTGTKKLQPVKRRPQTQ